MKKIIGLIAMLALFVNCGGSDSEVIPPKEEKVVAVNDSYEVTEDIASELNFLSNDTYTQGSIEVSFPTTSNENGIIVQTNNKITYTPAKSFVGADSFTYTICSTKEEDKCATATVSITVVDQGNPEAKDDVYTTQKNTEITISNFLENDSLIDDAQLDAINSSNANGSVTLNSNGTITYIPQSDFVGNDTFTYTICDDDATKSCSTATITIKVEEPSNNAGSFNIPSELAEYYKNTDFNLTGNALREELATTIISTHTTNLSYTPGVWDVLKQSDLDPTDNSKVVLIYGYDDSDGNYVTDRTRSKDANGGTQGTDWNREHVYPKSLGNPNLGTSGPGADAHHLRPSDVKFNNDRSSKKFATGSGNAGDVSGNWYPGDEWKGDVARMMMYMYLRYGNQCLPKNVAVGSTIASDNNMVALLLQWNAEDPVSDLEIQRNNVVANAQGNRNPFIDNPYLATLIWNGSEADNTWK
ncbi:endonuclease [Tenacibaculum sp. 47A_GOM-205m]|uniref:endonuclease n=1 Tax=Tenacibaculum sp. 47A_GOM-205m TaxID=1380384 RepID=UPI0004B8B4B5|nr:endonuclease [Tenacibaculum sp. 47A_GOM-205m]